MTTDQTTLEEPRTRVPIDPRIRQRRVAVRRDEGRRRLRLLLGVGGAVAAVVLGWGVTRSPVLDVDHVRVTGAHHLAPAEVLRAAGVRPGEAMTNVHEGSVAARVRRLPWVGVATVRRHWPGTVSVHVTERRPVASVRGSGDGWLLVDRTGRLLARVPSAAADVPAIENTPRAGAPGGRLDRVGDGALAVAAEISPERARQVRIVVLLPDGTLELRVLTGPGPAGIVRLGPPDDIPAKLLATFTVLDRVDTRRLAVLDVRVPSAPVVTRR